MGPAVPRSCLGPRVRAQLVGTSCSLHPGAVLSPSSAWWCPGVCRIRPRALLASHLQLTSHQQGDPQLAASKFPAGFFPSLAQQSQRDELAPSLAAACSPVPPPFLCSQSTSNSPFGYTLKVSRQKEKKMKSSKKKDDEGVSAEESPV